MGTWARGVAEGHRGKVGEGMVGKGDAADGAERHPYPRQGKGLRGVGLRWIS